MKEHEQVQEIDGITVRGHLSEGATPGSEEVWAIVAPVLGYHRAMETRDAVLLSDSLGPTMYRLWAADAEAMTEWRPGPCRSHEQVMRGLLLALADPEFFYRNTVEVLHVRVDGEWALVHTRESGETWRGLPGWKDAHNLWHVQCMAGTWRLVGEVHDVENQG